jgi:MurNAc alpha-1-phosphate uridylyltransferase
MRESGRPRRAMVLAAGLGERMRPITLTTPKPLIVIGRETLLDRALNALGEQGVEQVVVNAHHLADVVERHLSGRSKPAVLLSIEGERLETGGGVRNALPLLGQAPFFVVNGDTLWRDGPRSTLADLADAWDPGRMDALLLLHPVVTALGYDGPGDFHWRSDGRVMRRKDGERAPYLFAGLQILHPRLFNGAPEGAFSLNVLYDRAIARGRLYAIEHAGRWCHVGTPADIPVAEAFLANEAASA